MGLPSVNIVFQSKAIAAIERGAVGILALVLKDASVVGLTVYDLADVSDIPAGLSDANKDYLEMAFIGAPKMLKAIVINNAADYTEAQDYLEAIKFNVLVIPGMVEEDATGWATWAKAMRDNKERKIMVVLPNEAADHEGVINFTTENIKVGAIAFTASQYAARLGGVIAGLPLTVAPTYQVFKEVDDVPKMTKAQADAKVDAGELLLYHDGEKVKIARGVTSLTTVTEAKGSDWKKIKLVRILDMVYHDIKDTIEDFYIGKFQNSYENKLLLCAAINAYFETLEQEGVLDPGKNICAIDIAAQKTYLKSIGYTMPDGRGVDEMYEQEIKEANTRDKVFLVSTVRPLDAIEDVQLVVNL